MSVNRLGRYREKLTLDPTRGRRTCTELEAVTAVALFSGMGMWRGEGGSGIRTGLPHGEWSWKGHSGCGWKRADNWDGGQKGTISVRNSSIRAPREQKATANVPLS